MLISGAATEGHRWGGGCCSSLEEQIPVTAPESSRGTKEQLQVCQELRAWQGSAWGAAVTANDTLRQQIQAALGRVVVLRGGDGSGRAANALRFCFYSDI